jgi:NADH-quinone oxidoreductase subunit G
MSSSASCPARTSRSTKLDCDKGRMVYQYTEARSALSCRWFAKMANWWKRTGRRAKLAAEKLKPACAGMAQAFERRPVQPCPPWQNSRAGRFSIPPWQAVTWCARWGLEPARTSRIWAGGCHPVVASDLHQEAPLCGLAVKQAAQRGATLIVLGGRETPWKPMQRMSSAPPL